MATKKNLDKSAKPARKVQQAASRAGVSNLSQAVAQKASIGPRLAQKNSSTIDKAVVKSDKTPSPPSKKAIVADISAKMSSQVRAKAKPALRSSTRHERQCPFDVAR